MTKEVLPTDHYELSRDVAGRLNPLILDHPSATLDMVADALVFLSEAAEHSGDYSTEAPGGFALLIEVVRQAVKYEAHGAKAKAALRAATS